MQISISITIVLLLTTLHSLATAQYGDFSGSGDGGSGDGCDRPSDPFTPTSDKEERVIEVRCHLACIEQVMDGRSPQLQVSVTYPMWPAIPDGELRRTCLYQQVKDCREGCRKKVEKPSLNEERCTEQCADGNMGSCEVASSCSQENTVCYNPVDKSSCMRGCVLAPQLPDVVERFLEAPVLTRFPGGVGAGRYRVSPGSTTAMELTSGNVSSFIIRAAHFNPPRSRTAYYWLSSLDEELNLEAFACEEDVRVMLIVVDKFGTHTSKGIDLDVYGENDVLVPDNPSVSFMVAPDRRYGYWNHAEIKMTWMLPTNFEAVESYAITLAPGMEPGADGQERHCDNETIKMNITYTMTSATILANDPTSGPFNGCYYHVTVTSIPRVGEEVIAPSNLIATPAVTTNPVPINFTCDRVWDDQTGMFQFTTSWEIPQFPPLLDSLSNFTLQVKLVKPVGMEESEILTERGVDFERSLQGYTQTLDPVHYNSDPDAYFSIQLVSTSVNTTTRGVVPMGVSCTYLTSALPPPAVQEVQFDEESLVYTSSYPNTCEVDLEVGVSWVKPQGVLHGYEARLVETAEDSEGSVGEVFAELEVKVEETKENTLMFVAQVPTDIPTTSCFYFQMRSVSPYSSRSNWSAPQCIVVFDITVPEDIRVFMEECNSRNSTFSTDAPEQGKSMVLYVVVGLSAVMLIVTAILMMIMALSCIHHKEKLSTLESQPSFRKRLPSNSSFTPLPLPPGSHAPSAVPPLPLEGWELHPSQVLVDTRLGHGTFGDVFKGMIRGGVGLYQSRGPLCLNGVAIKLLKSTTNQKEEFLSHIEHAKVVAKEVQSPHIAKLIGCVTLYDPLCIVMELPCNGDLLSYLITSRTNLLAVQEDLTNQNVRVNLSFGGCDNVDPDVVIRNNDSGRHGDGDGRGLVTSKELLTYASEIAAGMECLSAIGMVHGDVACRNMYLDANKHVKITDFSLTNGDKTRGGSRIYINSEGGRLPVKWMAMELLAEGKFSAGSDVWAFGVTLWEIVTLGGLPYNGMRNKDILSHLQRGYRLKTPENCSSELYDLMISCWHGEVLNRPSFKALQDSLHEMRHDAISTHINPQSTCYKLLSKCRRKKPCTAAGELVENDIATPAAGAAAAVAEEPTGVVDTEESAVVTDDLNTGKARSGYVHLPIIAEEENEEEGTEVILVNDHCRSASPSESGTAGLSTSSSQSLQEDQGRGLDDQRRGFDNKGCGSNEGIADSNFDLSGESTDADENVASEHTNSTSCSQTLEGVAMGCGNDNECCAVTESSTADTGEVKGQASMPTQWSKVTNSCDDAVTEEIVESSQIYSRSAEQAQDRAYRALL